MSDYRISGHSRQEFERPVEPQDPVFRIPYDDRGIRIIDQALEVLARAAQGILDLLSRHCRSHEIRHCPHQVQFIIQKGGPVAGPKRERPDGAPLVDERVARIRVCTRKNGSGRSFRHLC